MTRFFFGVFGALLPDILLFWSKRFTSPLLTFELWQYLTVSTLYAASAGIIALVYPYRRKPPRPWDAIVIGISFPFIISGITAAADRLSKSGASGLQLRGPEVDDTGVFAIPGTIIDLMAAF
ncbi:hypothetical protein [Candidatus Thiosymbion oneisti]|uniref:hypothetical protein n=1 Tax=Candidatus Thiosymbion oneisti TaxID=589554 RepID=UPI00114CAE80|nr:hypothetical protein [Candidatus Thiosymbion oneisti]